MGIFDVFFGLGKCFFCKNPFGRNDVPKYTRMASGNMVKSCRKCYNIMGSPGQPPNVIANPPKPKKKPEKKKEWVDESKWW